MLRRFKQLMSVGLSKSAKPSRMIRAKFDAAQTTPENRRHWANADRLSADAASSPEVRAVLRSRGRYEVANNSYARGIANTMGHYVVGGGARLQMLTDSSDDNQAVERQFNRWAHEIDLAEKLRQMRVALVDSGEIFAIFTTNPTLRSPVKLDLVLIEADQVASPPLGDAMAREGRKTVDGIVFDADGNRVGYHVLKRHPGETQYAAGGFGSDAMSAELVIHLYRADRPGQSRGIPEITPALPLFGMLRDYTLAVLSAAQQAALAGGVIYTDAAADAPDEVEPMDEVEMERGTWMTMPAGWKMAQIRAEQPTTMYEAFKREIVNEMARCLEMPYNIAAGNSSGYNFASGTLDHATFFKRIAIDRQRLERVVLDRILAAWINEAALVDGLLPQSLRMRDADLAHQWMWEGLAQHMDPVKEANAQQTRLSANTTTLASEYARQGKDWEAELRQRARELVLMRELDIPSSAAAPTAERVPAAVDQENEDDD